MFNKITTLFMIGLVAVGLIPFATPPAAVDAQAGDTNSRYLGSEFDSNAEGWTIFNDGSAIEQEFSAICANDLGKRIDWYFQAPPRWLGDWSGFYGAGLIYSLSQTDTTQQYDAPDIVIVSGANELTLDTPYNPNTSETSYAVVLDNRENWLLNGVPATEAQIRNHFANVTAFRIRGEYKVDADRGCLHTIFISGNGFYSDFDTVNDLEDWGIFNDGTPLAQAFDGTDGLICSQDTSQGVDWYYEAPWSWQGDWSTLYNGRIRFGLSQSDTREQYNAPDIMIMSGNASLTYDTPNNPGTSLTSYGIYLAADGNWQLNGTPATESQIRTHLMNITAFRIRGEYQVGADSSCLAFASVLPSTGPSGLANDVVLNPIVPSDYAVTFNIDALRVIDGEEDATVASSGEDEFYMFYYITEFENGQPVEQQQRAWGVFEVIRGEVYTYTPGTGRGQYLHPLSLTASGNHEVMITVLMMESEDVENARQAVQSTNGNSGIVIGGTSGIPLVDDVINYVNAFVGGLLNGEDNLGMRFVYLNPVENHGGTTSDTLIIIGSNFGDPYEYQLDYTLSVIEQ